MAEQLASRVGLEADQIGAATATVGGPSPSPGTAVIRFHSEPEHELARRLAKELGQMGYAWRIDSPPDRPGAAAPPAEPRQSAVEVWLGDR